MEALNTPVIRTDGSTQIGMGHIMRCLALAQGLEKTSVRPVFIIRDYDQSISELIRRHGFGVEMLPGGCSWTDDLRLVMEYADRFSARLIITDLGHAGALVKQEEYYKYLLGLKDAGKFLVTIDDIIKMSFPSHIVINPHYGADKFGYNKSGGTRYLLGPAYFIFRPEFIAAAGANREIKKDAKNVLVVMGGSDPLDFTEKVAKALVKSGRTRGLNLRIVTGMDSAVEKTLKLEAILKDYTGTYELIPGSDNMAELMVWSDITITGAGLTKYEAAVTGTPCIIIPQYDYLVELAKQYEKTGAVLNLGSGDKITEEAIGGAAARLLDDAALRSEMSRKGRELVDGRGIERILSEIPEEVWS